MAPQLQAKRLGAQCGGGWRFALDLAGSGNRSGFPGPLPPAGTRQESIPHRIRACGIASRKLIRSRSSSENRLRKRTIIDGSNGVLLEYPVMPRKTAYKHFLASARQSPHQSIQASDCWTEHQTPTGQAMQEPQSLGCTGGHMFLPVLLMGSARRKAPSRFQGLTCR
jgi:hypothetical protein